MTPIQSIFLGERLCARPGTLSALEEVPGLDDVPLGVLDVQRAVAAGVLLGPAVGDAAVAQAPREVVQGPRLDAEGEVHVAPALVTELLLTGQPEAEPGALAGGEPDAVALALEHAQAQTAGKRRVR